jgi:hypothetical protein
MGGHDIHTPLATIDTDILRKEQPRMERGLALKGGWL